MRQALAAIAIAAAFLVCRPAQAIVDISVAEIGGDVVFDASGSLDITGFSVNTVLTGSYGGIDPSAAYFFVIPAAGFTTEDVGSLASFAPFGTIGSVLGVPSGSIFGIGAGNLNLPAGYSSFDPIASSLIIPGHTFASLGLIAGVYNSGLLPSGDFVRLTISAIPVPATLPLLAAGFCLIGLATRKRS
jgi:hypothetical protein